MPSELYDLGELEHIHNNQNLKLRTNISITLSSAENLPLLLSNVLDLETLISSGTWIAGGNRLQFHIKFFFDDIVIPELAGKSFTEDVGVMLCNAEIWSQLHQSASLSLDESNGDQAVHCSQFSLSLRRKASELLDVQPPRGVPSAYLEAVKVFLSFSTCRRIRALSKTQGRDKGHRKRRGQRGSRTLLATEISAEQSRNNPWPSDDWSPLDIDDEGGVHNCRVGVENEDFSLLWTPFSSPSTTILTSSQNSDSSHSSLNSAESIFNSFNTTSSRLNFTAHDVKFEDILRMMNDSLSIVISDRRPRNAGGIILSGDTGFPRLEAISPAIFSPGYLEAISLRRSLMSNIAHAMLGIRRRTTSRSLNEKSTFLEENPPDDYRGLNISMFETSDTGNPTPIAGIESHLWSLLQRQTINPRAWPRWSPQILNASKLNHGRNPDSCMLDEPWIDSHIEPGLKVDDFNCPPSSQDGVLDHGFNPEVDDEYLDGRPMMGSQYFEDSLDNKDLTAKDNYAEEKDFWAALDIEPNGDYPDEIMFEDILETSGYPEEDISGVHERVRVVDQDLLKDTPDLDKSYRCSRYTSYEHLSYQGLLEGELGKGWSDKPDIILDDSISAMVDKRCPSSGLTEPLFDDMFDSFPEIIPGEPVATKYSIRQR